MKLSIVKKIILIVPLIFILFFEISAQRKTDTIAVPKPATPPVLPVMPKPNDIKPYKDVITSDARTSVSFITVHKVNERCFFELPDSILGRDLMTVNRIEKSSSEYRHPMARLMSYAGDWIGESVIRFERVTGNKIMLKMVTYKERSVDSSENGLLKSLDKNNTQPIYAAFPIKALNNDKKSTVIDITDFVNSDNAVFGFQPDIKFLVQTGMVAPDRSYIDTIKAYPINIEISSVKTFTTPKSAVTFTFNNSIVLLPKEPMKGRQFDPRVGFFDLWPTEYTDFDGNPMGKKRGSNIWRWRMEPKPGDMERYHRGELVEPQKPIIIYIDPLTPKKWVPYLIKGVNDWQVAFEKAGFKNAIMAKEAPTKEEDSTWSIDDASHSALVYKPSDFGNAMGPSVKDPRSGEIIETHISWYHSVMEVLYKWYFIQAGGIDPRANKPFISDSLMGELIRFVSSHEVGHTLGLRHNWGASSTVPVEKLRDRKWLEANGHTPSIMDYARFNYVAQPEDSVSEKGIFPRIGDYDKWAIEWGYRIIPGNKTREEEAIILNDWIVKKLKSGPQFYFGIEAVPGDSNTGFDPRNQNEDLGDDAVLASGYGIKNLKRIKPHLIHWTKTPNNDYAKAGDMYQELLNQFQRYMGHVLLNIGGIYTTPKTVEQQGPVYSFVSKENQKRAMLFLQKELFNTPEWLRDESLYSLSSTSFQQVEAVQKNILVQLLDTKWIYRLTTQEGEIGSKAYTVREMLSDLKNGIFEELASGKPISLNRRNLQKVYVTKLISLLANNGMNPENDAFSVVKAHTNELLQLTKAATIRTSDKMSVMHLADLQDRLSKALHPGK